MRPKPTQTPSPPQVLPSPEDQRRPAPRPRLPITGVQMTAQYPQQAQGGHPQGAIGGVDQAGARSSTTMSSVRRIEVRPEPHPQAPARPVQRPTSQIDIRPEPPRYLQPSYHGAHSAYSSHPSQHPMQSHHTHARYYSEQSRCSQLGHYGGDLNQRRYPPQRPMQSHRPHLRYDPEQPRYVPQPPHRSHSFLRSYPQPQNQPQSQPQRPIMDSVLPHLRQPISQPAPPQQSPPTSHIARRPSTSCEHGASPSSPPATLTISPLVKPQDPNPSPWPFPLDSVSQAATQSLPAQAQVQVDDFPAPPSPPLLSETETKLLFEQLLDVLPPPLPLCETDTGDLLDLLEADFPPPPLPPPPPNSAPLPLSLPPDDVKASSISAAVKIKTPANKPASVPIQESPREAMMRELQANFDKKKKKEKDSAAARSSVQDCSVEQLPPPFIPSPSSSRSRLTLRHSAASSLPPSPPHRVSSLNRVAFHQAKAESKPNALPVKPKPSLSKMERAKLAFQAQQKDTDSNE